MPQVSISVCEKCGNTFTINLQQYKLPIGMRPRTRRQNEKSYPIHTWADWIEHITTHCVKCRFDDPPLQAVEDLKHFEEKNKNDEEKAKNRFKS